MTKIIVDTNIWIDFLAGNSKVQKLKSIVEEFKALRHIWVECELRVGNFPSSSLFFEYYKQIPVASFVNYEILFNFIRKENLSGRGLTFVDIGLYASAKMGNHKIWTNDKNLKKLCESKRVLYHD